MLEDKKIFHFSKEDVDKKVFHTFLSNSGISEDKPDYLSKIERLEKTAIRYKQFADPLVDVRAVVAKADFSINGEKIIIGGKNYGRIALPKEELNKIKEIYAYVLCAGEFETDIDPVTDAFVDLWGSAYCDTGLEMLKGEMDEIGGCDRYISSFFGPGYFEIEVERVPHINELVDGKSIGVDVKEHLMVPLKSCAGFFLVSDEPIELPKKDCKNCLGNRKNCNYCNKLR